MEWLRKIIGSKLFKEILRLILAAAAGYGASGCAALMQPVAVSPQLACRVAVLRPYLGDAAAEAALQLEAGAFDVLGFLDEQDVNIRELRDLVDAYLDCDGVKAEAEE